MNESKTNHLAAAIGRLGTHDHLCLIYETQEEQFAAVVPFVKAGLDRGDKCIYVVDENTASVVLEAMRAGGISVDAALGNGALAIFTKQDTYLRDGDFDPDRMIRFLKKATDVARQEGYRALRVTGEMTWVLGGGAGVERLIEYEAKLNYFFPENDALAICQYNRRRFNPEVVVDVIQTHPLAIFGGIVCRNFYYTPPDEFLRPDRAALQVERLLRNIFEREQAEDRLQERSAELEKKNAELETLIKGFAGQEVRMVALKEEIRKLRGKTQS